MNPALPKIRHKHAQGCGSMDELARCERELKKKRAQKEREKRAEPWWAMPLILLLVAAFIVGFTAFMGHAIPWYQARHERLRAEREQARAAQQVPKVRRVGDTHTQIPWDGKQVPDQ